MKLIKNFSSIVCSSNDFRCFRNTYFYLNGGNKMRKLSISLVIIIFLSACATSGVDISQIEIGDPPSKNEAEQLVLNYLAATLKDPDSLKDFKLITGVKRGALNYGAFNKGPSGLSFSNPMYYVCVHYNAKNSYGAYVGRKTYAYFIYNGQIQTSFNSISDNGFDFGNTKFDCRSG